MKLSYLCALLMCALSTFLCAQEDTALPSYFSYAPEKLKELHQLPTSQNMDLQEVRKWDGIAMREADEKKLSFYDSTRVFTYLYVAQADAAYLSQNLIGEFKGSLDPVSYQVLSLFFPDLVKPLLFTEDPYSLALAQMITAQVEDRIKQENSLSLSFSVPEALQQDFSAGLGVAKWIPWFAKPSIDYWPSSPPSLDNPVWKEQIAQIKAAQNPMTEEKKEVIYLWAGLAYPWSGDWRNMANQHLLCRSRSVPLKKVFLVRSTLMVGLYDCVAAYTTCKYHYLLPRPQKMDPSIRYEIPVPKHPSYPAGHAAESTVATRVLTAFFPVDAKYWQLLGEQCRISRIWAGVHYPLDNEAGKISGSKVADKVLSETLKSHN